MTKTIHSKSKHITSGSIILLSDNIHLVRTINNPIYKDNILGLDAGAETAEIKNLIETATINIVI